MNFSAATPCRVLSKPLLTEDTRMALEVEGQAIHPGEVSPIGDCNWSPLSPKEWISVRLWHQNYIIPIIHLSPDPGEVKLSCHPVLAARPSSGHPRPWVPVVPPCPPLPVSIALGSALGPHNLTPRGPPKLSSNTHGTIVTHFGSRQTREARGSVRPRRTLEGKGKTQ